MIKLLLLMVLMHIVDDYYLQGILASMKQKSWWEKQEGYTNLYRYDYRMALLMHSMSWSIMILMPAMVMYELPGLLLFYIFIVNVIIHYYVDDLKANKKHINLVVDQMVHMFQIIATWSLVWQWV